MSNYPDDLLAAQDKAIPEIEKEFLRSVKVTIKETDWDRLDAALQAHADGQDIVDGMAWEDFDPQEALRKLFEVSLEIHGEYIGEVTGGAIFDYVDPKALEWIEKHGAERVVLVTQSTKDAIADIVKYGYENGMTPRDQGQLIRELVGLDPPRARTYQAYVANLKERGVDPAKIRALSAKKYQQLLTARANTIAVNETSDASGYATYASTKSAVERGVLDPNLYEAFRIVTADERTCDQCRPLSGEARKLPDESYPSTGSQTVKVHIKCRCAEGLREMKKQSIKKRASGIGKSYCIFDTQALKRKDGVLYVPTVPLVEGVYEQWGLRVLRSYAEFSQYTHWLFGVPIVVNHEEVTPDARRVGQLFDIVNKQDGLKTAATSRFYELDLTQRELETLLSGEPHDGSLSWSCFLEEAKGEWVDPATGARKQYDYKEVGPYVFYEYSFVKQGVIGTNDGAGFNMQCKSHSSAPGGADSMTEETESKLVQRLEALEGKVATLEQENTGLKGEQTKLKESIEAKQEADQKALFVGKLKPAFLEAKDGLWKQCKEVGYLAFEAMHPEMIIKPVQEKKLHGSAMAGEGGGQPATIEEANQAHQAKMAKLNQEVV